jgi:hypothetical protein
MRRRSVPLTLPPVLTVVLAVPPDTAKLRPAIGVSDLAFRACYAVVSALSGSILRSARHAPQHCLRAPKIALHVLLHALGLRRAQFNTDSSGTSPVSAITNIIRIKFDRLG